MAKGSIMYSTSGQIRPRGHRMHNNPVMLLLLMEPIDVTFDFTADTPGFWEGFWERNNSLGYCGNDPDSCSPTLRRFLILSYPGILMSLQFLPFF